MTSPVPPGRPEAPPVPDALPVVPLRDSVVFPFAAAPLAVAEARSVQLIDDAMRGGRLVALVAQRDPQIESAGAAATRLTRYGSVRSESMSRILSIPWTRSRSVPSGVRAS